MPQDVARPRYRAHSPLAVSLFWPLQPPGAIFRCSEDEYPHPTPKRFLTPTFWPRFGWIDAKALPCRTTKIAIRSKAVWANEAKRKFIESLGNAHVHLAPLRWLRY